MEISSSTSLPVPLLLTITELKEKPCKLLELPDNLILNVMEYLSLTSIMGLAVTCKKLNSLSSNSNLWTRLDLQDAYLRPGKLGYLLKRNPRYMRLARAKVAEPQLIEMPLDGTALQVTHLDLSNTEIDRNTMSLFIGACKNLKKLSLEGLVLGVDIFEKLNPKMHVLNLGMTSNLHLPGFIAFLQSANKLKVLNMCWIQQAWTSAQLMEIVRYLPSRLFQLSVSGYPKLFNNMHIAVLVDRCPRLEKLDLSDNNELSAVAINHILRLEKLEELAINRCLNIGLLALESLKHLKYFEFLEIQGFTSAKCPAWKIQDLLNVNYVNHQPFFNIGRPTSESNPSFIWRRRVYTLNREKFRNRILDLEY